LQAFVSAETKEMSSFHPRKLLGGQEDAQPTGDGVLIKYVSPTWVPSTLTKLPRKFLQWQFYGSTAITTIAATDTWTNVVFPNVLPTSQTQGTPQVWTFTGGTSSIQFTYTGVEQGIFEVRAEVYIVQAAAGGTTICSLRFNRAIEPGKMRPVVQGIQTGSPQFISNAAGYSTFATGEVITFQASVDVLRRNSRLQFLLHRSFRVFFFPELKEWPLTIPEFQQRVPATQTLLTKACQTVFGLTSSSQIKILRAGPRES
jgi:hypothetical protein